MPRKSESTTPKQSSASRKATRAKRPTKNGSRRAPSTPLDPEKRKLKQMQKSPEKRLSGALRRLGVDPEQVEQSANISDILKQGKGGLKGALAAMRYSTDVNVVAFLEKYDEIPPRDRDALPWEAIAIAADVQPAYLLGGTILALRDYSANTVKILALTHHPEVTRKTIAYAALPGGEKDRHTMHQALGFLPSPKGSTFIINPGSRGTAPVGPGADEDPDVDQPEVGEDREGDLNHLFPALTETQEALVPPSARMLEAAK